MRLRPYPFVSTRGFQTPSPSSGGVLAAAAAECNITVTTEDMPDISGCYIGRATTSVRGAWVQPDESSWIEWQVCIYIAAAAVTNSS